MSKGDTHDNFEFEAEIEANLNRNIDKLLNEIGLDEDKSSGKGDAAEQPGNDNRAEDVSLEDGSFDDNSLKECKANSLGDKFSDNKKSDGKFSDRNGNESRNAEDGALEKNKKQPAAVSGKNEASTEKSEVQDGKTVMASDKSNLISERTEGKISSAKADTSDANNEYAAGLMRDNSGEDLDDTISNISESLAKQIDEELGKYDVKQDKKKKRARTMKIQIGIVAGLLILLGLACFLSFTQPGNRLLLKMGINIGGKIWDVMTQEYTDTTDVEEDVDYIEEEDLASDAEEIDPDTIEWPEHPGDGRHEDGVYNILLLGEEAIGSGNARGRTDLIIIATLNKNQKTIKLTSLMRDLLVQIPGYNDNKLNSAYEKGGIDLLYETIAKNFDICLDGSILVNFESFEKIVDILGGLEITLTASEAKYLRNTNYISDPRNRNVVEGKQLMNGNQVLGYARIRKRAAITGKNNDYGRTDRHRIILNAIFEKYKTSSKVELLSMMLKILPLVTTDINSETFEKLIDTYLEMGTMEIEQLRIPADGTFKDNVKVRGMDVLIPDLDANKKILHEFIFGSY